VTTRRPTPAAPGAPAGSRFTPQPISAPPQHTTPPAHAPAPASSGSLNSTQQGIYDLMLATLKSWGLETLGTDLKNFIVKGDTSPDTLTLELANTDAYKKRFAGNELRKKNGLPELNPAQYLGVEEQYNNVMRAYGLPAGFYDQHEDFTKMIGNGLSPDELKTRAQAAHDQYIAAPEYVKNLWSQYFGNSPGDAIAAILDPTVATAVIQDRANQVGIGGAGAQFGLAVSGARAKEFSQAGVTLSGAQKAYQQIAASIGQDQSIAKRFGQQFGQQDEENDLLLGDAQAGMKRRGLYNQEEALFRGSSGLDQSSIGAKQGA
jgi:hypothetical protein